MRTNIFNVKEKKDKKIIIEEYKGKNRFLIFFKRHKNFILLSLILFGICLILIGTGLAFSVFQASTEIDISFLDETEDEIGTNNDPNITDDVVTEELLGEISRTEGVVILTETFMNESGDVIYYYSDKSSIIVLSSGKIYRVSSLKDGNYGIDKNGNINSNAKKKLVKSTTSTLSNGAVVTYYTDGTAKLEHSNTVLFVRDSNNIKLVSGNTLYNIVPSGVSTSEKITKSKNEIGTKFTDGTTEITGNNQKYIVNKKVKTTLTEENISYDKNNTFKKLLETNLSDGNQITYYENGSAVITDKNSNKIYVKKSGDITIKNNKIYEIITNDYGYSKATINSTEGKKVTYFDNGAAIITYKDGTKKYVEDSDEIVYENGKKISTNPETSDQKSVKKTTNGEEVVNFDNGKSQVIKTDGTSYITDTSKIIFDTSGNIEEPPKQEPEDDETGEGEGEGAGSGDGEGEGEGTGTGGNPTEGLFVSEAEHKYNYSQSVQDSNFIIKNTTTQPKDYRIVIEEIKDYNEYNTSRLDPRFVKFQATVGDTLVDATRLTTDTWTDEDGDLNYVIYDGTVGAKASIQVAISLYVDYAELDNSYQNKGFIGTIKVYVDDGREAE